MTPDWAANDEAPDPLDNLDAEELTDYHAAQRNRGRHFTRPSLRIFPVVDRDGIDDAGFEWGARTYGDAS